MTDGSAPELVFRCDAHGFAFVVRPGRFEVRPGACRAIGWPDAVPLPRPTVIRLVQLFVEHVDLRLLRPDEVGRHRDLLATPTTAQAAAVLHPDLPVPPVLAGAPPSALLSKGGALVGQAHRRAEHELELMWLDARRRRAVHDLRRRIRRDAVER